MRARWAARLQAARRAWAVFRPALDGESGALVLLACAVLLGIAVEVLKPWPLKWVIDGVARNRFEGGQLAWAGTAVVVLAVTSGAVFLVRSVLLSRVGRRVVTRIRRRVFEHVLRLPMTRLLATPSGDLLTRVGGDVNQVRDLLLTATGGILERGILVLVTVAMMVTIDPVLSLVAIAPFPLFGLLMTRGGRKLRSIAREQRRREGRTHGIAVNAIRQIRLLKSLSNESEVAHGLARVARSGERAAGRSAVLFARISLGGETLAALGFGALLVLGGLAVRDGQLSAGNLVLLASYARGLAKPLRSLTKEGARFARTTASAERLLDVLGWEEESRGVGRPVERLSGNVRFENLALGWPGSRRVLSNVSLEVREGDLVVLRGQNGAGKTTLLAALLRMLRPEEGRIVAGGTPVEDLELGSYRRRIAFVPQDLHHYGDTVADTLALGRPGASLQELRAALDLVRLGEWADALPEGLETQIGEGGARMSGGESRRLMLARAALQDCDWLILDEPLAGVDPASRPEVLGAIAAIARGRTTWIVTHDPMPGMDAQVELRVEGGRIVRDAEAPA